MTHPAIEAAARAVCMAGDPDQINAPGSCHRKGECIHPAVGSVCPYQAEARAAILAFLEVAREPSEGMRAAANRINHARDEEIYQAMIERLRKEIEE